MKRRHVLTAGVAVAAAATGAGWAWRRMRQDEETRRSDETLWKLRFERPEGGDLAMSTLRGRPLVVNFWATWCAPCVREMPLLDAFYREHQPNWQVVGLAVDGPSPVRDFLGKVRVTFPIGLAGLEGVELARVLGNEKGGLPFTAVFNSNGSVAFRKLGVLHDGELAKWVTEIGKGQ